MKKKYRNLAEFFLFGEKFTQESVTVQKHVLKEEFVIQIFVKIALQKGRTNPNSIKFQ